MNPQICLALDFEPEMNAMLAKKFKSIANFIKLGPQNIFEIGPSEIAKYKDMGQIGTTRHKHSITSTPNK